MVTDREEKQESIPILIDPEETPAIAPMDFKLRWHHGDETPEIDFRVEGSVTGRPLLSVINVFISHYLDGFVPRRRENSSHVGTAS